MTAKLAKIVLSVVVGMLGLVLVMVALAGAEPVAARDDAGQSGGSTLLAGVPSHVEVNADPGEIRADGYSNSTVIATVESGCDPVPGAFVVFTTTLGTIDQYCYVEAEDAAVNKSPGDWTAWADSEASGGAYVKSCGTAHPHATLDWTFTASAISMLYVKEPEGGVAEVQVDGSIVITVDMYADPKTTAEQVITTGLGSGSHVITVRYLTKSPVGGGACIGIDAFRCGATTDEHGQVTATLTSATLSCGSEDATVTAFVGAPSIPPTITNTKSVKMTASAPDNVTVTATPNQIVADGISTSNLEATVEDQFGEYVPDCTMVGFVATDENGAWITLPYKLAEGEDPTEVITDGWSIDTNGHHGGEAIYSNTPGATASWDFTGTAVSLIYPKLSDAGVATVTVDGGSPITIDMYAASDQHQVEHVITNCLSYGPHVIEVTVGGYTTGGTDTRVYVDAFRSGASTSGGKAQTNATSGTQAGVVWVEATGVGRQCCETASVVTDTVPITLKAGNPYTLTITPAVVSITCCVTSTLQFTVTDEYSNVVGAVVPRPLTVDFTSTPDGDFTPSSVEITNGVGSVEFHGYEAGSGTITGTVNGIIGTAVLTVAPASCNTLDINADQTWIYITDTHTSLLTNFPYTTTITAELRDKCNNPVEEGTAVTFTTSLGSLSPANPITTVNGIATAVLTSGNMSAGVPTQTAYITVTGAGCPVSDTTSVDFGLHVYTLTVTAVPDEMVVGGNLSTLTADVKDGFGSATPNGVRVVFTTTPTARAWVLPGYVETESGKAITTATSLTQTGLVTITAVAGSTVTNTTLITITAGDPHTLTITPADISITCCMTSTLQFTVTDQFTNVVGAVVPRPLTVDFTSTPQGIFTPTGSVVITQGVGSVIFHGWAAGSGTITGTVGDVTGTASLTVAAASCQTLTASADRTWIYVTDTHTSLLTNFPYTTTITAELRDKCNNPVEEGTAVTFTTSLGSLSPANPTTVNGVATAVLTAGNISAGVPTQTAYITVTGAGCPVSDTTSVDFGLHVYTLTVAADPDEMRVGGITSTLTADVRDGFGGHTPDGVPVTFTIAPALATVSPGYAPTEGGTATVTATSGTQAGVATIVVTATGSTITNTGLITITAGNPHTLTITPAAISITCCMTSTLQFTVTDQFTNVVGAVASRPVTVCLYCTPDNLVDSWSGTYCSTVTTGTGRVDFHGWMSGTGTIRGYCDGFDPPANATSNLTVSAGSPAELTVIRAPTTILADGFDTAVITATVKDACQNPVCHWPVTFTTDLGGFEPTPLTLSVTRNTNCSGVATATLRSCCVPNTANITVTVDSLTETTYVDMAGVAWDVQLAANPTSIQVGGYTSNLTATVSDQFGHPVLDGTVVTFTTSSGSVGSDTIAKTTTGGVAAAVLTSPDTTGTATITATAGAGADAATDTVTVTFEAGLAYTVTLDAYPTTLTAGSSSALTAKVVDQYNNDVADGTVVTFTTSLGEVGSNWVAKPTTSGVATATLTSTISGRAMLTATADSRVATTTVQFEPDSPYTVTLEAYPMTLTVGSSSALTATVVDQYSNDVADGTVVTFTTSLGEVGSESVTKTTASGVTTAELTSQDPGIATVTAEAGSVSDTADVTFEAGPPYTVTLEANPTSILVAGYTSTLTATVVDQFDNNVADDTEVLFETSLGSLSSVTVTKLTANGMAIATLTSETTAGTAVVTATSDSKVATTTVEFMPLSPYTVTLVAYPTSRTVGETSTLSATVVDQYDNHVADGTVVTFTTSLGEVGSESVTKTTASGVTTAELTSHDPGTATVTATTDSVSDTADVTFEVGPPHTVTLEANPTSVLVGGFTSTLTVTVVDQFSNNVADGTVVTFTTTLGELGSEAVTKTTVSSVATATLTSGDTAGVAAITAAAGSAVATTVVTFTPDVPHVVALMAHPTSIPIGGFTSEITATVRDQYDNLVADGTEVTFETDLGSVGSSSVVTITTNGAANATLTSGLLIGTANLTATSGAAEGQTQVVFTVGAPETVIAESWPPTIEVGGNTATITATVTDVGGYSVADGTPVVFTTDFASLGSTTVTEYTADGVAVATLTSGLTPGVAHITATADSKFDTATVKVAAGPPFTVDVTADPAYIPIGGATSRITATVKDRYGNNVVNGTNVEFVTSLGSVLPPSDTTNEGKAVTTLTSGMIKGPATVIAIAGGEDGSVEVIFTVGPPFSVNVVADPTSIGLNGQTSNIQATVKDIGGNNVADGTEVTFDTSLGLLGSDTVIKTTTSGVAEAVLTSETTAGTAVITATADSHYHTTKVVFSPDPPHDVTVTAAPMAIPANGVSTSTVRATVTDQYGNLVADGITCYFDTTLGGVWPPFDTTLNGVAETTLTSSETTGLAAVTATCEGIPDTIYVSFYVPAFKIYLPTIFKAY